MSEAAHAENEWHELAARAAAMEPALRARVAELWTTAARYEHASIASFDRFALQLLSLGAPPGLLEGAHRAALDEIEHARLSFRVASIYAGRPLGPGPLPIDPPVLADFSLGTVLAQTVEEGCVGETLAAAHAEQLLEHVVGSALRKVFAIIQRDEATHAALAYQLARWAIATFGDGARRSIDQAFDRAIAELHALSPEGAGEPELWSHGQLSEADKHALSLRALAEIVEPARRELLWMG